MSSFKYIFQFNLYIHMYKSKYDVLVKIIFIVYTLIYIEYLLPAYLMLIQEFLVWSGIIEKVWYTWLKLVLKLNLKIWKVTI